MQPRLVTATYKSRICLMLACKIQLVLNGFLAVTAIGGGVALMGDWGTPPVALLAGSPFGSYLIPGAALTFLVGGSGAAAFLAVWRRSPAAWQLNLGSGIGIITFEIVELLTIGSPAGPGRVMQVLYLLIGVALIALALLERRAHSSVNTSS